MIHLLSHCALVLAMRPGLRGFRLVLLVVFCCLALGANAGGGSGSALMLPAHAKQVQLSHATYLFEDPGGQLTLEDVLRPSNQARFEAGSPGLGFTSSAYWLRFTVSNPTDAAMSRWFDTGNRSLQEVDLYLLGAHGEFVHLSSGSSRPFAERLIAAPTFVFPVSMPALQTTELYLRVRSTGFMPVSMTPTLSVAANLQSEIKRDTTQWLIVLGIALALGTINLLLFAYSRDTSYLLYTLSVMSIVWAVSSAAGGFGAAYEYLWPHSPLFEELGWIVALIPCAIFPYLFIMRLVNFRARHQRLAWAFLISMGFTTLVIGANAVLTLAQLPHSVHLQQWMYRAGAIAWGSNNLLGLFCIAVALRSGIRAAKFVAVGFTPMVLCIFMLSYQSNHGLPMTWVAVLIAMVFEWFVMALALADRFNQMRLENARRQATEIENLQASERRLEEKVAQRTQELRAEQMRTKELLNNMLPDEIAQELADTGASKPVRHESVSVLFADLVGFTQAAATMPPDRMVAELNTLFAGFDRITDECGIDKIKTIGDAYMAAAGVLKPCSDHALRCVRAALRMLDFLEAHNSKSPYKWGLRLGVHTGPVVSGVVGTKRFALDIWGDTVNIAARMERGGETGRVNVSAYTYDLIQKEFDCEYRGKIEAKGKGTVDMYFVIAPS